MMRYRPAVSCRGPRPLPRPGPWRQNGPSKPYDFMLSLSSYVTTCTPFGLHYSSPSHTANLRPFRIIHPSSLITRQESHRRLISPLTKQPAATAHLTMAASPTAKRQKSSKDVPYELIYWPGLPGRGEHVRLALEEAGAEYTDTAHIDGGMQTVLAQINAENLGDELNPPPLAPPILKHGDLLISQTPNILLYLGPRIGLAPKHGDEDEDGLYRINALALTALDGLSNEAHDTHHPIATGLYYEDQKEESKRKAKDYIENRLPKFFGYFERVLKSKASGEGPWLYGGSLTYADLVLWQVS